MNLSKSLLHKLALAAGAAAFCAPLGCSRSPETAATPNGAMPVGKANLAPINQPAEPPSFRDNDRVFELPPNPPRSGSKIYRRAPCPGCGMG